MLEKIDAILEFCHENRIYRFCIMIILLAVILTAFFFMNAHTPLIVDDFCARYIMGTSKTIDNIDDVLESVKNFYIMWGGRVGMMFSLNLFVMLDKWIYNAVNTFAMFLLLVDIYFLAIGSARLYPALLLFITGVIFLFTPVFGQDYLWIAGATNYLWGPALGFALLIPYRFQVNKELPIIKSKLLMVLLFVYGVIIGCYQELVAFSSIACILVIIYYFYKYNNHKVHSWMFFGLLGCMAGFLIFALAPGNFARLEVAGGTDHSIFKNMLYITKWVWDLDAMAIPLGISAILATLPLKNVEGNICKIFITGAISSMYLMALAPDAPSRVIVIPMLYIVILSGYLYSRIDFSSIKLRRSFAVAIILMGLNMNADYNSAMEAIYAYENQESLNVALIEKEKAKENFDIIITENVPQNKYCAGWNLETVGENDKSWVNAAYAKFYGVNSIIGR